MHADILETFVEDQVRGLFREQVIAGYPPYAAVVDIGVVERTPRPLRAEHPVNLEALGDGSFVQVCPSLGYKSLWAEVANDQYRDSYREFLS